MDHFEDIYGYNSAIDWKVISPDLSLFVRTRLVRKMILLWIVNNRRNKPYVRNLILGVERSIERKEFTSMEDSQRPTLHCIMNCQEY